MMSGAMSDMLSALWTKSHGEIMARVTMIESASLALRAGALDSELRLAATREAHKLAGVAGMFGYWEATDLAREAEDLLGAASISEDGAQRIAAIALLLREQLG